MFKVIWRIILVLLPVMVIIGLVRVGVHGFDNTAFLPESEELIAIFAEAPQIDSYVLNALTAYNEAQSALENSTDFWTAIVNFFTFVGSWVSVGVAYISFPFAFIGYIIVGVLGFN